MLSRVKKNEKKGGGAEKMTMTVKNGFHLQNEAGFPRKKKSFV